MLVGRWRTATGRGPSGAYLVDVLAFGRTTTKMYTPHTPYYTRSVEQIVTAASGTRDDTTRAERAARTSVFVAPADHGAYANIAACWTVVLRARVDRRRRRRRGPVSGIRVFLFLRANSARHPRERDHRRPDKARRYYLKQSPVGFCGFCDATL